VPLIRTSEFVSRMHQFVNLSEESFGQLVQFALASLIGLDRDVDIMPPLRQHSDAHRSEGPVVTPGALAALDLFQMQAKVPVCLHQDFVRRQLSAVKISHASRRGCWVKTAESQAIPTSTQGRTSRLTTYLRDDVSVARPAVETIVAGIAGNELNGNVGEFGESFCDLEVVEGEMLRLEIYLAAQDFQPDSPTGFDGDQVRAKPILERDAEYLRAGLQLLSRCRKGSTAKEVPQLPGTDREKHGDDCRINRIHSRPYL